MINRRNFLATAGCTAATIPLAKISRASSLDGTAKVETLHRLSDEHPGFAYFAGLPGHLGMPFSNRIRWFATDGARAAFADLQSECDVACVILGSTPLTGLGAQHGHCAAVAQALGWCQRDAVVGLAPHGATLALTMPRQTWTQLRDEDKAAITSAAAGMLCADRNRHAPVPIDTIAVDRIAEAVVAEFASHDSLTRRIDSLYFAFKAAQSALWSKNVV